MIRFKCRCGYDLETPTDLAGLEIQCPRCGLLNDVPLLSDVHTLARDGTYTVQETTAPPAPPAADDLMYIYAKRWIDEEGNEIDLRNTADEMEHIGVFDSVAEIKKRSRPRYDPVTGELITEIPVAADKNPRINPADIPFAKAVVEYGRPDTNLARGPRHVIHELIQPINVVSMAAVMLIHVILGVIFVFSLLKLFILSLGGLILTAFVMGHYGNVVDEIGVEDRDDLPRLLRDARWHEDIWWPFVAVFGTLMLCFLPALVCAKLPVEPAVSAGLFTMMSFLGAYLIPAVLLTLVTSGHLSNMRPDRILKVVHTSGTSYFFAVVLFVAAYVPYLWGALGILIEDVQLSGMNQFYLPFVKFKLVINLPRWITSYYTTLPLLALGIFLMHAFCYQVGMLYRAYHGKFPWVGRYHVSDPKPPVPRRKPQYLTPPGAPKTQPQER